jgi:hypothetical protein
VTVAFDTLKFARALRDKANMTAEQAEGVAEAFSEATAEQLANKADLAALGADLRSEIASLGAGVRAEIASQGADLRAEISSQGNSLRAEIATLKADGLLLKWMVGFVLTLVVAVLFLQLHH